MWQSLKKPLLINTVKKQSPTQKRSGVMRKRWELVLAGLVGIIAFFLGRRGKSAAEDQVEIT